MIGNRFSSRSVILLIVGVIIFRFCYSLTNEFWFKDEDVLQIYLIGLKSFTTGNYPYFGADLVYTHSQIPGALQGYLVSVGWFVWQIPEAPMIVLNVLLDISSLFLVWYISKRLPQLPLWILICSVFLVPWSICYFTRVINPSYVIPGAIVFFIGIFEIYPHLKKGILPQWLSYFFLGFGLVWIFQLHMSWVLLGPYIALAFYYLLKEKSVKGSVVAGVAFIAGCSLPGMLVAPTLLRYGLGNPNGTSVASVVTFHIDHLGIIFKLLTSFLAYGSFDVSRFIGANTLERTDFLTTYLWAAPFTIFVGLVGLFHAIYLLFRLVTVQRSESGVKHVTYFTIYSILLFYFSSLFSSVAPPSHAAVLFFPVVVIYSLYVCKDQLQKRWVIRGVLMLFTSAAVMYAAIAYHNYGSVSLYKDRDRLERALDESNYRIVGERRYDK